MVVPVSLANGVHADTAVILHKGMTPSDAEKRVYDSVFADAESAPELQQCRLCFGCAMPKQSIDGQGAAVVVPSKPLKGATITDAGVTSSSVLLLQTRTRQAIFCDISPSTVWLRIGAWCSEKLQMMPCDVSRYSISAYRSCHPSGAVNMVQVPEHAAPRDVIAAVSKVTGFTQHSLALLLLDDEKGKISALDANDDAPIAAASGDVCILVRDADPHARAQQIVSEFTATRNMITVCYNDPSKAEAEFTQKIKAQPEWTLAHLKMQIGSRLSLANASEYHLRKSAKGPQFKDETLTLAAAKIIDGSVVCVRPGAPIAPDHISLRLFRYNEDHELPCCRKQRVKMIYFNKIVVPKNIRIEDLRAR